MIRRIGRIRPIRPIDPIASPHQHASGDVDGCAGHVFARSDARNTTTSATSEASATRPSGIRSRYRCSWRQRVASHLGPHHARRHQIHVDPVRRHFASQRNTEADQAGFGRGVVRMAAGRAVKRRLDVTLTILPGRLAASQRRTASRQVRNAPTKLICSTRLNSASLMSRTNAVGQTPALLTRISIGPSSRSAAANSARYRPLSPRRRPPATPSRHARRGSLWPVRGLVAQIDLGFRVGQVADRHLRPSAANPRQIARPRPRDPPVTMATRFLRFKSTDDSRLRLRSPRLRSMAGRRTNPPTSAQFIAAWLRLPDGCCGDMAAAVPCRNCGCCLTPKTIR